jgi:hypothetical protein
LLPTAELHVSGPAYNQINTTILQIDYTSNASSSGIPASNVVKSALTIRGDGFIGIGTDPVAGQTVTLKGLLKVDSLQIGGDGSFTAGTGELIVAPGMRSPGGFGSANYLSFGSNNLSNITNVVVSGALVGPMVQTNVIQSLSPTAPGGDTISFSGAVLSNISALVVDKIESLAISKLSSTSTYVANTINVSATILSNVGNVLLSPQSTLYTNSISAGSSNFINLNNSSLKNVQDLAISGKLSVQGTFVVVDSTTTNSDQFRIENDGTSTAFIVNQLNSFGNDEDITQFMSNSNVVAAITGNGRTVFGNFGQTPAYDAILPTLPSALMYLENPAADVKPALYVKQYAPTTNIATFVGTSSNAVVLSATGRIGIGSSNILPDARIHIIQQSNVDLRNVDNTDFIKFSVLDSVGVTSNLLWVSADGNLHLRGYIEANGFRMFGSSTNADLGTNTNSDNINNNSVQSGQLVTLFGNSSNPSLAFSLTLNSNVTNKPGIFAPDSNTLAFTTSGYERLRISSNGYVGIGVTNPLYPLQVAGAVNITGPLTAQVFSGSGASLTNIPGSAITSVLSSTVIPSQLDANVGIGTNAQPLTSGVILHVYNSNTTPSQSSSQDASNAMLQIRIEKGGFASLNLGTSNYSTFIDSRSSPDSLTNPNPNPDFYIATKGTERLRIAATTGYVGIGTSSPSSMLDVRGGNASISGQLGVGVTGTELATYTESLVVGGHTLVASNLRAYAFFGNGSNLTNLNASSITAGVVNQAYLPSASTSYSGIVVLSDSLTFSTPTPISSSNAATPYSVYLANSNASSRVSKGGDIIDGDLTVNANVTATKFFGDGSNLTSLNASSITSGILNISLLPPDIFSGISLDSTGTSNSTTLAASAASVYLANSNISTRVSKGGDTMSGNLTVSANVSATKFYGDGSNITNINASSITSGVLNISLLPPDIFSGISLDSTGTSNSTTLAASAASVYLANSNISTRVSKGGDTMTGNLIVNGDVTATKFYGDGSNLSNLNASRLASGIVSRTLLPSASTTVSGIVVLSDSVTYSTPTSMNDSNAATPYSVYLANSNASSRVSTAGGTITGELIVTQRITAQSFYGDGCNVTNINASNILNGTVNENRLPFASTTVRGIVMLEDSYVSSRTDTAATANSVRRAYDNADSRVLISGDTMIGNLTVNANVTATKFYGDGCNVTNINASNITFGILNRSLFPSDIFSGISLDSTGTSNSTTLAASAASVYLANSNISTRVSKAGDTITGTLTLYDPTDVGLDIQRGNITVLNGNITTSNVLASLGTLSNLKVIETTTLGGMLIVGTDAHINGTLYVNKIRLGSMYNTTFIDGTLSTTLSYETQQNITSLNVITVNQLTAYEAILGNLASAVDVVGSISVGSNLIVSSNAYVNNTLTVGKNVSTSNVFTNTLSALNNDKIVSQSPIHITNSFYDDGTGNTTNDVTTPQVGLHVDSSIMVQSVLTISDKRVKTDIVPSSTTSDLSSVLSIPVCRYRFIDRKYEDDNVIGFIAQEVEKIAPFAVKTLNHVIPSILDYGQLLTGNTIVMHCDLDFLDLESRIKIIYNNVEYDRQVSCFATTSKVKKETILYLDEPIPFHGSKTDAHANTVFVYGHYVSDFKVIDTDRLMPLVFNSVKALNHRIDTQSKQIEDMMQRLNALEIRTSSKES